MRYGNKKENVMSNGKRRTIFEKNAGSHRIKSGAKNSRKLLLPRNFSTVEKKIIIRHLNHELA
jgi:hypothetical protein